MAEAEEPARFTHLRRPPLSSVLRRDGAARRDPCGANLEALLFAAAPLGSGGRGGVVGVEGSGFTVMLDLALSVLEPVMELKREPSSVDARGIVTKRQGAARENKETGLMGKCHSTSRALGRRQVIA